MNRDAMYWRWAQAKKIPFSKAKEELDTVFAFVLEEVRRLDPGTQLFIRGFGTFMVRERKARMRRHPRTEKPIHVEGYCYPHFKFAKSFAAVIREEKECHS